MTDSSNTAPGFATLAIHAGAAPDPSTGARVTPIYQTTSYVFNDVEHAAALFNLEAFSNIYTRIGNPTQAVLEQRIAALEGGTAALAVASGHAAQTLMIQTPTAARRRVLPAGSCTPARSISSTTPSKVQWNVAWADATDPASFKKAITPKTKAIFCELIANPGGVVIDLPAIAKIAKKGRRTLHRRQHAGHAIPCRPKEHGADIIVHSLTGSWAGTATLFGGVIVDCGTFDWLMAKNKYGGARQPNPS